MIYAINYCSETPFCQCVFSVLGNLSQQMEESFFKTNTHISKPSKFDLLDPILMPFGLLVTPELVEFDSLIT